MAQEKWLVDGPKTIDIDSARTLKVGLIGGQIDIVAHDEPGVRVEVHSVSGKELKVSVDGDTVEIDHPQLGWDNWIDVFRCVDRQGARRRQRHGAPRHPDQARRRQRDRAASAA